MKLKVSSLFIILVLLTSSFPLNDAFAADGDIIATISVGSSPKGIAFDSANNRMYVANSAGNTVSVIDTSDNSVDASTISVGSSPQGIAFDSANNRMYVANYGPNTVSVINTATNAVIATISVGSNPYDVAFDSANNRMYVANYGGNTVSVIDTSDNSVDPSTISVGSGPRDITFDSANNRMYVTNTGSNNVSVINTATNAVIATISVGSSPRGVAFDSANNRMYVVNNGPNNVSVIDTSDNSVDPSTISVGSSPHGIAFDSANNRMYVVNYGNSKVSVINTATNAVIATISVGSNPFGIAFDSANNRMYVTNHIGNTVSVIETLAASPSKVGTVSTTPGNSQVALSWVAPSDRGSSITDYIIQYSTDDSTWSTFADGTSTGTTATVTGLDSSTLYYFQVAAVNSSGTGLFSSSSSASATSATSSSDCYDCEAPKLTKVEVHVSSSPFDYVWNFDQKSPYPMFGDAVTPIVADPGDKVEIILELTDNRTLKRVYDSGVYTNFLTKPNDMNTFYANNFDEYGKVSTTYYEWHQTGEDLVYDYDNTVEWSAADITIQESAEYVEGGQAPNLDGLVGTFSISFKMKFLQPMQTTDMWIQATDRSGNFFKVSLPLTLEISGNEPLLFESKLNQKVLSFYNESLLFELISDWTGSSQDVSELTAILGIPDEQLLPWVTNLAIWVSEDKITIGDMIVAVEYLIN